MSELTKIAASQTPYNRRSRLDPHLADLRRLQSEGFSLAQLKEFLKEIGVTVSRQSIYDFLKRRESATTEVANNNQKKQDKSLATPDLIDEKEEIEKPTEELIRPPGISDGEWNSLRAKIARENLKKNRNLGE